MIEISQLAFDYGRRKAPVFADFSLTFEPGRIYGLLGKNGTGKSTLLYLLCGLLRPCGGSVLVDGQESWRRKAEMLQDIFFVPEEFNLPNLSLDRYVAINRPLYPHFDEQVMRECLDEFELPAKLRLGSLSMGQKKKAFISLALAAGTRYLLLDEPTNGLDIPAKSLFRRVVSRYMTDERTIIVSTHQARDVDMLLDHVVIIDGSSLRLSASTADICARLRFESRPAGASLADALYVQPSLQGNAVVCAASGEDDDTPLDLELLFNAVQANPSLAATLQSAVAETASVTTKSSKQ